MKEEDPFQPIRDYQKVCLEHLEITKGILNCESTYKLYKKCFLYYTSKGWGWFGNTFSNKEKQTLENRIRIIAIKNETETG